MKGKMGKGNEKHAQNELHCSFLFCQDCKINFVKPQVKCSVRGDLGPACNSAGMIDRSILGVDHLYAKPVYRNLKVSSFRRLCAVNLFTPCYSLWHNCPF